MVETDVMQSASKNGPPSEGVRDNAERRAQELKDSHVSTAAPTTLDDRASDRGRARKIVAAMLATVGALAVTWRTRRSKHRERAERPRPRSPFSALSTRRQLKRGGKSARRCKRARN